MSSHQHIEIDVYDEDGISQRIPNPPVTTHEMYAAILSDAATLMTRKNKDYGDSWQRDRATTLTDTIRHKLDRLYALEELAARGQKPEVSEGEEAELLDIINYAVFRVAKGRGWA